MFLRIIHRDYKASLVAILAMLSALLFSPLWDETLDDAFVRAARDGCRFVADVRPAILPWLFGSDSSFSFVDEVTVGFFIVVFSLRSLEVVSEGRWLGERCGREGALVFASSSRTPCFEYG